MGKRSHKGARLRGDPDPTTLDEHSSPGTIIAVFPDDYACRVRDDLKGATYDVAVPGLIQDAEGSGGEVSIPRVGQRVELKFGSGTRPRISRCLPEAMDGLTTGSETPPLFEREQPSLNLFGNAPNNFRGYMPKGLMAGDWCRIGNLGQHIGVFDGGVATLSGSKWAQVRAVGGQGADTLSLYGRRMNIYTDFGNITFGTEDGKSYVELLGGTDQTMESGVDRENWTVRAAIGKGEGYANFAILDRDGEPVYKTVMEADGTLTKMTSGDVGQVFTGDQSIAYEKAFTRSVLDGDDTLHVSGNRIENFTGSQTLNAQKNQYVNILSDGSKIVGGNDFTSCKTHDLQVAGRLDVKPKDAAALWKISNGSLDIHVGQPPTDLNTALSSFNVTVYPAGSKVSLQALLGNVEMFSSLQTKIDAGAEIAITAGASLSAKAGGQVEIKAGGALMGEAVGVMQLKSTGPSMFGSDALVQLGGLKAADPVVKGISFLSALAGFLGTCSAAGKAAAMGGGSVPSMNGGGVIAIGTGADVMLALMSSFPSLKVMTE